MRRALALLVLLAPAVGLACDDPSSSLYRFNPNAVVEQPMPALVTGVRSRAGLAPTTAGGCFDEGCPDASHVTFVISTDAPGNFGYEIELIDPPDSAPFLQGAAFAAPNTEGRAEVTILWGSDDQFRGETFQARVRTVNLKGELGAWSQPVTVVPASVGTQSGGLGVGWMSLLVLLGLRGRRLFSKA